MDYHLSIAGERSGPHTQFQIIQGIRDERFKGDELVWRLGMPEWQPLRTMREFEDFWPVSDEALQQAEAARKLARAELDRPRPWLRFWARLLDFFWFQSLVTLVLLATLPNEAKKWLQVPFNSIVATSLIMLLYVPCEAWCLARRGMTPGRMLLRIQVRTLTGGLPTFPQAMKRSLEVFIKGTALWLPIVSLFAMSWFRLELMRHGTTSWDEVCETRVEHGEPELWRYLILTGIVVSFALLVLLGAAVMAQGQMSRLPS